MSLYPVDVIVEVKTESSSLSIPYTVKVNASSRAEAREKARTEILDFLEEKNQLSTAEMDYTVLQVTLQKDPNITRSDRKPFTPLSSQPKVMGIPNDRERF